MIRFPAGVLAGGGLVLAMLSACGKRNETARRDDTDPVRTPDASTSDAHPPPFVLGPEGCPLDLPMNGAACTRSPRMPCSYRNACDAGGSCRAECGAGIWFVSCDPCISPPPCPATPPKHGSDCTAGTTYSCTFDSCADGGTFLAATCEAGKWGVDSRICDILGCRGGEDDFGCPQGNACVRDNTCRGRGSGTCIDNPCRTEPFSCACAQVRCPPGSVCDSAVGGVISCKEPARQPSDPTIVADGLPSNGPLALYGGTLYVATGSPHPVVAIDLATGAPNPLGDGGAQAYDVAADSSGVYWSEYGGIRTSTGGSTTMRLVDGTLAAHLALDAKYVYFATGSGDTQHPNWIGRVAKTGGAPEFLFAAVTTAGLAVDASAVYFADRQNATNLGLIRSMPLAGGTPTTLASEQGYPAAVVVDAAHVFWIDDWAPDLRVLPKAGGMPSTLYTGKAGLSAPMAIAIDATTVYFTDTYGHLVAKVPIAGGDVVTIAQDQDPQSGIAVDDAHVYWTAICGRVLRAPK